MSNWKKCSLGQVVTFASGSSFSEKYQGMKNEEYDFYKVSDMNTCENNKFMITAENTISKEISRKIKAKIHPKNTVIFPKVGAALLTNKRRITTKDSIFDNNIMGLIATEEIDYLFLYYFMSSIDLGKYVQTGAIPSVNNTIVENIMVQLPPMVEQQKIAEILSSVDAAIEKTEQVIAKTEEVKKGLMQQLLTKGIGHTEFKQTEIGEMPVNWTVKSLEQLSSFMSNGFVGVASPFYTEDCNGVNYLMSNNVRANKFDLTKLVKITPEFHQKQCKTILKKGDMLTVQSGHIGTSCIVNEDFDGANCHALIITRFEESVNSAYVSYYLNSTIGYNNLKKIFVGSTIKHINVKDFKKFKIPVPSFKEQTEIVSILKNIDEKISKEENELLILHEIKKGLMQQLLTGQVRVKID